MQSIYAPARQHAVTSVLSVLDEQIFYRLAKDFSQILGYEVGISMMQKEDEWLINYSGSKRLINFYFGLYDKGKDRSSDLIAHPFIKIYNLSIYPQGKGLGTGFISKFLEEMKSTQFRNIILLAQEQRAVRFWSKFGFKAQGKIKRCMTIMTLEL